jgi:acylphosphatase
MKAVRLMVHGIVQGVWFRAGTREAARSHGVSGWVRNSPDGCVEVFAQGPSLRWMSLSNGAGGVRQARGLTGSTYPLQRRSPASKVSASAAEGESIR